MYNYVGDISKLAQNIVVSYMKSFNVAVDATLGNGHDTDFLSDNFKQVFSFDIQKSAVDNYRRKEKENVVLIHNSHERLSDFVDCKVDCIMYNLGFMPGGDKAITTLAESTISSLKEALKLLNCGGIITLAIYPGHEEGKREEEAVLSFVRSLSKREYGVMLHSFINRNTPPMLLIIEKNSL